MQARQLPAIRGWNWIVEGFRLFLTNPALLTFLVFGYWLALVFLNLFPLIGMVIAPLCVPALSVGVMNGCRAVVLVGVLVAWGCGQGPSEEGAPDAAGAGPVGARVSGRRTPRG